MRSAFRISMLAAVVAAMVAVGTPIAGGSSAPAKRTTVVTKFSEGQFPEGLAVNRQGGLFVSVTTFGATQNDPGTGRVVRITGAGQHVPIGPVFKVGFGVLTGLATNDGAVYVAVASNQAAEAPGVWRIGANGKASRVLKLTEASFPNGLAFRGRALYVSDSARGVIWKAGQGHKPSAWVTSKLLSPASRNGFGANGIAFRDGALYVAVTDRGTIVRIPILSDGSPGTPVVWARSKALSGADGITFDTGGRLYVATSNHNTLVRLSESGQPTRVAGPSDGLLYPTTPAFSINGKSSVLYVVNGDFNAKGTPSLMRLR